MKNKKTLYFLVPLAGIIWGFIFWKIFSFNPEEEWMDYTISDEIERKTDTSVYRLVTDYGDPFLRSESMAVNPIQSDGIKKNNVKPIRTGSKHGPEPPEGVIYYGVINGITRKVGLMEIKGEKLLVQENHFLSGLKIIHMGEDSLTVACQEKKYRYAKQ